MTGFEFVLTVNIQVLKYHYIPFPMHSIFTIKVFTYTMKKFPFLIVVYIYKFIFELTMNYNKNPPSNVGKDNNNKSENLPQEREIKNDTFCRNN
jgi:hypothetical protein